MNNGQLFVNSVFKMENSDTLMRCFVTWIHLMKPDTFHECVSEVIETLIRSPISLDINEMGVWLCDKSWMLISPYHMMSHENELFLKLALEEGSYVTEKYDYALISMKGYKLPIELTVSERMAAVELFINHFILYKISQERDDVKKFASMVALKSRIYQIADKYPEFMELCINTDQTIIECLSTIKDSW